MLFLGIKYDGGRLESFAQLRCSVIVMLLAMTTASTFQQVRTEPSGVEVLTHVATSGPPGAGVPVCLAGRRDHPIGYVGSVLLMPGHENTHDLWEVIMILDREDASRLSASSVAYATMSIKGDNSCGGNADIYLEIQPGPKRTDGIVKNGTVLQGQVSYMADIGYMEPRSRPREMIEWIENFIVMDVGVVYAELTGLGIAVVVGVMIAFRFRKRKSMSVRQEQTQ